MSQWKTNEEIAAELLALRGLKDKVRQTNAFGDDNRAAIEAQCSVLESRMRMDQVNATWGNDSSDDFDPFLLDAAITARDWMSGVLSEEDGKPSENWAELVPI